jgi:hypothetical protein
MRYSMFINILAYKLFIKLLSVLSVDVSVSGVCVVYVFLLHKLSLSLMLQLLYDYVQLTTSMTMLQFTSLYVNNHDA